MLPFFCLPPEVNDTYYQLLKKPPQPAGHFLLVVCRSETARECVVDAIHRTVSDQLTERLGRTPVFGLDSAAVQFVSIRSGL